MEKRREEAEVKEATYQRHLKSGMKVYNVNKLSRHQRYRVKKRLRVEDLNKL